MRVLFTEEAERDLEAIGDRIAFDNPARAASFVAELVDAALDLATFPRRFAIVPGFEEQGVRHRVHGNYLIFYRDADDAVVILHILHGAMEYSALLEPGV